VAIYDTTIQTKDYEAMFWVDPKRYRCTIWHRLPIGTIARTMVDNDPERLRARVEAWIEKRSSESHKEGR